MQKSLWSILSVVGFVGVMMQPVAAEDPATRTLLGLQNPYSAELAKREGAGAVRLIHRRSSLNPGILHRAASFKKEGIPVIFTIHLWFGPKESRIPAMGSEEWEKALDEFDGFLRKVGPSIEYISLDNEPLLDVSPASFQEDPQGRVPAIEFYKALAARARQAIRSDGSLAHIKVASPALHRVDAMGRGETLHDHLALLEWMTTDPNIDVVDIHTHVREVGDLEVALAFIKGTTTKPIIITEWSQAGIARGWLNRKVRPALAAKWKLPPELTHKAFVEDCYEKPVEKEPWDDIVATAPYDETFMSRALQLMVKEGVAVACYGAHMQYKNVYFDTKQLLANKTVVPGSDGEPQENYKFAGWFREMAKAHAQEGVGGASTRIDQRRPSNP